MANITSILPLFLISLLFFSSPLLSSADAHAEAATLVPHTRLLLHEEGREVSSGEPEKMKVYMKKRASAGAGARSRGKHSSAFRTSQVSSFQFGAVIACPLLLGFLVV